MSIINISRQPYSSGEIIAGALAEKLNYKLIDKSAINQKLKDFYNDFSDEINDLANEKKPGFFKQFFNNHEIYACLIMSILFEEASQDDIVILGRGGQYIIDRDDSFNVRIIEPFATRCSNLQTQEGINPIDAKKMIKDKDHERGRFIRYLFGRDISNADSYDLIVNHDKLSTDAVVAMILDYAKKMGKLNQLSIVSKKRLKCRSLEKKVEATIKKRMRGNDNLTVECKEPGCVKIAGFISGKFKLNNTLKIAQSCYGVTAIDNQLILVRSWV